MSAPMDGQKIIKFPSGYTKRFSSKRLVRRASSLPGFRVVTGEADPVTDLTRERVTKALGLDWSASLVIDTDDPTTNGKRDFHLRFVEHDGVRWKVKWMDRTRNPGKKRYGLTRG